MADALCRRARRLHPLPVRVKMGLIDGNGTSFCYAKPPAGRLPKLQITWSHFAAGRTPRKSGLCSGWLSNRFPTSRPRPSMPRSIWECSAARLTRMKPGFGVRLFESLKCTEATCAINPLRTPRGPASLHFKPCERTRLAARSWDLTRLIPAQATSGMAQRAACSNRQRSASSSG